MVSNKLQKDKRTIWAIALFLSLITFISYLPALTSGFVDWDDDVYILQNPYIQSIDANFFRWVFTSYFFTNWHPLTVFSFAVDYSVWELNPFGYHLTNLILHILNTCLVFTLTLILMMLRKPYIATRKFRVITAFATALLFGIHPIHVESVAWVSERKDVLYGFFFLLAILAYLRYVSIGTKRKWFYYSLCLAFFVLSLMSKAMAVTFPVVLLILDLYPIERFKEGTKLIKILFDKIPFLVLSLITSFIAILAQGMSGALVPLEHIPLASRILVAMSSYIFYLTKMVFPLKLSPFYPYPDPTDVFSFVFVGSAILFVAITVFSLWKIRKKRQFSAIWLYYIITLMPVIGIIKAGEFAAADRYTYLPTLSLLLFAGTGVGSFFDKPRAKWFRVTVIAILFALFGLLMARNINQATIWHDSVALWSYEINLYPDVPTAYINRGMAYRSSGNYRSAIDDLTIGIELNPALSYAYFNRGYTFMDAEDYKRAIADFTRAIELSPKPYLAVAYMNRGIAYWSSGDFQRGTADLTRAIELDPKYADAYYNRGYILMEHGDFSLAIEDITISIKLKPRFAEAYNSRGAAFIGLGNYHKALNDLLTAIELDPKLAEAYNNLGSTYGELGNYKQAIAEFSKAIELNPEHKRAHYNRGIAYAESGDIQSAITDFKRVIEIDPKDATAYSSLGGIYSKLGKSRDADIYYRKSSDLGLKPK